MCIYIYIYSIRAIYIYTYIYVYIYMVTRSAAPPTPPQMVWEAPPSVVWVVVGLIGKPFSFCGVGSVGGNPPPSFSPYIVVGAVGGNPPPSFSPCGVGCCGWESPFLLPLWCGVCGWEGIPFLPVVWGLVGGNPPPSLLWCGVWWGRVRAGKSWWAHGGREASLVRQTIFCARRFCSETLGCPFKCFGRPWKFLLGTIQYRAINSALMTSRPPIIDYTLCHILYMIYSRVYTIYYRLYSVYMVYLYTIARPLKGGNQVLHTSLRAMWEPDYSILQHTRV